MDEEVTEVSSIYGLLGLNMEEAREMKEKEAESERGRVTEGEWIDVNERQAMRRRGGTQQTRKGEIEIMGSLVLLDEVMEQVEVLLALVQNNPNTKVDIKKVVKELHKSVRRLKTTSKDVLGPQNQCKCKERC